MSRRLREGLWWWDMDAISCQHAGGRAVRYTTSAGTDCEPMRGVVWLPGSTRR